MLLSCKQAFRADCFHHVYKLSGMNAYHVNKLLGTNTSLSKQRDRLLSSCKQPYRDDAFQQVLYMK